MNATRGIPQSLLIQLRAHYPTASLLAELVQIQGDQKANKDSYVVRAIVNVEGQILATALAAASTVEEAENQARQRVLDVLGVQALVLGETKAIAPPVPAPAPEVAPEAPIASPPMTADLFSEEPAEAPTLSKAKRRTSSTKAKVELSEPEPEPVEISGGEEEDMSFEAEFEYSFEASTPEPEPVAPTSVKAAPKPSVDLSDVIAQIGAQIDRIGWTKKQGSTYLQDTYNKKTRVELTDEELFEFLDYLKSLPAKVQPMMADLPF
jgi:hypothetical protein